MIDEQNKEDTVASNFEPEPEATIYTPAATRFFTSVWYSNAPV
jgi:hypothetical protein